MNDTKVFNSAAQGILAKLLATENITVHVGDYRTAFFDTKNRILGLPTWNVKSKHLSDLLVGHEVGHALWTEQAHIDQLRAESPHIPFDIYNIVEDVRIERMIQNRYPGLISSFTTGYDELHRDDFFGIAKANLDELNFSDRLNLKAKLGHRIHVPMNDAELAIFKRCTEAETFDDVYQIVKDIYEMVKAKKRKPNKIPQDVLDALAKSKAKQTPDQSPPDTDNTVEGDDGAESKPEKKAKAKTETPKSEDTESDETDSDSSGGAGDEDGDSEEEKKSAKGDGEQSGDNEDSDSDDDSSDEESDEDAEIGGDGSGGESEYDDPDKELTSPTLDRLQENLAGLQADYGKITPIIMPTKAQLDEMVTPWADVLKGRMANPTYNRLFTTATDVHADWLSYKKKTKKQIQPLINEFERRKAAFQYSRSKVSDSGEIDVNRLHSYRFNDEIFRSVTKLADAKNHGMVFLIDYSSSMSYDIYNILDQTLNIVMFCQAVGIPFQVFGFSSFNRGGYVSGKHPNEFTNRKWFRSWDFLRHQIDMCVANVFELLSSDMKKEEQELAMRHLRAAIFYHENRNTLHHDSYSGGIPFRSPWEKMDTTPLQEALIILHRIVEKFKARYHVQRMNVLVLTDGGPDPMYRGSDSSLEKHIKTTTDGRWHNGGIQLSTKFYGRDLILREGNSSLDRIAGIHNYAALIENLRLSLDCTLIGFFISRSRTALKRSGIASVMESKAYPKATNWNTSSAILDKELRSYSKNKCMFINGGFNYDCYFLVDSHYAAIDDSEEFESSIDDEEFSGDVIKGSAKNKLAREFTKFNADKRTSRLVLAKFAEMVS